MELKDRFALWLAKTYGDAPSLMLATNGAIAQKTTSNWKGGKSQPAADALRILHELGCNITWLVVGEGSMFNETERGRFWAEKYRDARSTGGSRKGPSGPKTAPPAMVEELEAVIQKWR